MIECCDKKIWYKKRCKKKRFFSFIIIFVLFISLFLYYKFIIVNQVESVVTSNLRSYATDSVNQSVILSLNNPVLYSDIIKVEKNSNGDIVLISTDSFKVNSVSVSIADYSKIYVVEKIKQGIPVPFLSFLGFNVLSGYGFNVNFKTVSVGSVYTDLISEFKSVGINQTLHSIYANVVLTVNFSMPTVKKNVEVSSKVLLCETVLIGKVPETYLNGNIFK